MINEKISPQMLVASSQHFVEDVSDELIEQLTNDFENHLDQAGVKKKQPQSFYTVFHVDLYKDSNYEMELWVQAEKLEKDTDNITFKSIPESEIACILVSDDYENLKFAYDALFDYLLANDYIINGYPRETYIFDDNSPLGYYTEIQLPFSRKVN